LAVFSSVLLALALLIPATGKSGFLDLGWRGALCMAPLVFLGRNVMRGMSKSGGEDEVCVSRVPAE
jgi:hypothetical protein